MITTAVTAMIAAKVIIFFILIYIYIPGRLIRFQDDDGFLDRCFISMISMMALTIVIVHTLAFLKLYETFSLLFAYLATYTGIIVWRGRSLGKLADALGMKAVAGLLDMAEGAGDLKEVFRAYLLRKKDIFLANIKKFIPMLANPFKGFLPIAALAYSAYLRFHHSFAHTSLGVSDSYEHMAWVKYLGANELYRDGIYPHGQHAVLSAMEKLTLIDPFYIFRFMGPVFGLILVLSVYYATLKLSKSYIAALLALFICGTVTSPLFPQLVNRQISVLPQEFSTIFILPGFYFAAKYLAGSQKRDLFLYAACQSIALWSHQYAGVYLLVWSAILLAGRILFYGLEPGKTARFALTGFLSVVGSLLPYGIAYAQGKRFFLASAEYAQKSLSLGQGIEIQPASFWTGNIFIDSLFYLALAVGILALIHYVTGLARGERHFPVEGYLAVICLVMYFFYRAEDFQLPMPMDAYRTGLTLAPLAAVFYGAGLNRLFFPDCKIKVTKTIRQYMFAFAVLAAVIFIHVTFPPVLPENKVEQLEYDAAAVNYIQIRETYPLLQWTIVAPNEQYDQALGKGWHYQLIDFVRDFSIDEASDANFRLPIPTPYVFIFTEKRPLHAGRAVDQSDLERPLKTQVADPDKEFYRDPEQRAAIQARAIAWMAVYQKSHGDVNVFYEDEDMKIYLIEQEFYK